MAFKQSIKTRFEETALIFNYLRQIRMASLSLVIFIICGDFCIIPGENFLIYAQTAPQHIALTLQLHKKVLKLQ